jgi:hypothetical protein
VFTARRTIPSNRVYSKENLQQLGSDLREAGFERLTVKLPHNLVGAENHEVLLEVFLERGRNYPAMILVAQSVERRETIKFLFVNISSKTYFIDDTFPSGHSEPSEFYVQSPDPARVYGLSGFFGAYLDKRGRPSVTAVRSLSYIVALCLFLAQLFSLVKGNGFFTGLYPSGGMRSVVADGVSTILALIVSFSYYRLPSGLYINPLPNRSVAALASRAIKGEVMDNPLVSFVVTVFAGVVTALLLKLLGVL